MSLLHLNLTSLIETAGYAGLFFLVFAESGLFFGFFLPGDSLLFTAGILASQGFFNPWLLTALLALGAILGDSVGYWFGWHTGPRLFSKEDSLFFHRRHLERTKNFYDTYGAQAVLLARLVPVVRTFAPIFAGIGCMSYSLFLTYNIIGGLLWSAGFTLLGFFLGAAFPQVQQYLLPISIAIIVLSLLPLLRELLVAGRKGQASHSQQ